LPVVVVSVVGCIDGSLDQNILGPSKGPCEGSLDIIVSNGGLLGSRDRNMYGGFMVGLVEEGV
jgi:hypothetical protein